MFEHIALRNGVVVLPDQLLEGAQVYCRDGKIVSLSPRFRLPAATRIIDARGGYIAPGFIDIHVHGGNGCDFMDGTEDAVRQACAAHARHGTTTLFPTTTTGSPKQIHAMISACKLVQQDTVGPNIAGVHLYGPYFAEDKVGCHPVDGRREPVREEYNAYFETGLVKIATCAAELAGAAEFYKSAKRHRCLITCGHSNASFGEMEQAFKLGMRHVDHFWCAMSSVPSLRQRCGVPMQASMAEFVLLNREMSTEVIADGCHLAPELLEFAYRMLGPQRLCLVTDCNRALDLPPGRYRFGNEAEGSWFDSDGKVGWASEGSLASSVVGLDHMVRHMKSATSATLPEVIRMASLTPAERTGISEETGSIEVGKRADLLVLSKRLKVKQVIIRGMQFAGH
jgi:N-acetylglucosamine-6-phosphate deacetylase